MLQTIRDRTQGWIAGTIISIIIVSFALWGIHSYFTGGGSDNTVAEVNGIEISKTQLAATYERMRRQIQSQYGADMAAKNELQLKDRALQSLIQMQVLRQASINENFVVADNQVESYLENIPDFQVNGQFSLQRFQDILASVMLSAGDFLELIRTSLLIDQPRLGIELTSFAMPDEINNAMSLVNQERDFQYLTIPSNYFLTQGLQVPNDLIQNYYNQHKDEFKTTEQVSIDYLKLSLNDVMSSIQPSEAVLKSYYDDNSNSFGTPGQWNLAGIEISLPANASTTDINEANAKANNLLQRIQKGEDFINLAKQESKDFNHQLHGWFNLSAFPTELQKTIMTLNKPDQIVGPIRTSNGLVILKVLGVKAPQIQPYAMVKSKVKDAVVRQQAEEKFAKLRDQLSDITYEHPDNLTVAAKSMNLTVQSSNVFTRDKGSDDITNNAKVRETAFSNDVVNLQNNSDVIQVNPETYVVLRLKSHTVPTLLPFTTVQQQIRDKLAADEAEKKAAELVNTIKQKLIAGEDLHQLATTYHLTLNQGGYMGRYSNKIESAILDAVFQVSRPQEEGKPAYTSAKMPSGYAVIVLNGVKDGAIADKKQYTIFGEQVQNSEGLLEYELYKNSLLKKAKISVNQQAS